MEGSRGSTELRLVETLMAAGVGENANAEARSEARRMVFMIV